MPSESYPDIVLAVRIGLVTDVESFGMCHTPEECSTSRNSCTSFEELLALHKSVD